jgi:hypothetical protein
MPLTSAQYRLLKFWLPPLVAGGVAWGILLLLGDTPLVRASGLAVAVVGVAGALRRFGAILSVVGALMLVVSPSFWSQTGGGDGNPATIVLAIGAAIVTVVGVVVLSKRPALAVGLGVLVFAVLFSSQIGTPRSIRLTAFAFGWLMFLLTDMLLIAHPNPSDAPSILQDKPDEAPQARPHHVYGILLLFSVGVLNDAVLTFLAPSLVVALLLSRYKLAWWYWIALGVFVGIGSNRFVTEYLEAQSTLMVLEQWRNAARWIDLVRLVVEQFTPLGILLGVLGLARLSRWYPPLGGVTMLAYGAYAFFGLIYLGARRDVLLMPLFIIQVIWMTYAAFALSEWLAKAVPRFAPYARLGVQAGYGLLPLLAFWRIVG